MGPGLSLGFEALRTLILDQYEFDQATIEANFLPVPSDVVEEMAAIETELLPDVPLNNIHGDYPQDNEIHPLPADLEESFEDEGVPKS